TTGRGGDAGTGKPLMNLEGHRATVRAAVFSPDGRLIVTASDDRTARIWDAETGRHLRTLKGHGAVVYSVAFNRDGTRIVTASGDRTARVWDVATGIAESALKGHGGHVYSAEFSPDGERIVTASEDKTARVWRNSRLDAFTVACAAPGNNTDLSDLAERYGLAELKPICGVSPPDKVDLDKMPN